MNIYNCFEVIYSEYNGMHKIKYHSKYNFITKEQKLLSDIWFDDCDDFHNGFSVVRLRNHYNLIDENGNLISHEWFDECGEVTDDGLYVARVHGFWYLRRAKYIWELF